MLADALMNPGKPDPRTMQRGGGLIANTAMGAMGGMPGQMQPPGHSQPMPGGPGINPGQFQRPQMPGMGVQPRPMGQQFLPPGGAGQFNPQTPRQPQGLGGLMSLRG